MIECITTTIPCGITDGWAGHYFAMGGALAGGQMHGSYPTDVTPTSPWNAGRGRMIPTLSWESILAPMAEWMGVHPLENDDAEEWDAFVFPNAHKTGTPRLPASAVFQPGTF